MVRRRGDLRVSHNNQGLGDHQPAGHFEVAARGDGGQYLVHVEAAPVADRAQSVRRQRVSAPLEDGDGPADPVHVGAGRQACGRGCPQGSWRDTTRGYRSGRGKLHPYDRPPAVIASLRWTAAAPHDPGRGWA